MRTAAILFLTLLAICLPARAQQIPLDATSEQENERCNPPPSPGADKPQAVYIYTHIDTKGQTSHSVVVKGSGDTAFDNASIGCLQKSIVGPARQNGIPIEFDWIVQIRWPGKSGVGYLVLPNPNTGISNDCLELANQANQKTSARPVSGQTKVKFQVTVDGDVANPVIEKSSDSTFLDDLSLACVKTYKYFPGYQDKKRIPFEWTRVNNWSFR